MRILLVLVLAFGSVLAGQAHAQAVPVDTDGSTLSYTGHHPLHSFTGTSNQVRGTVQVDPASPQQARIEIVVPVESFDSGNSNRDSNMLDATEADRYPDVRFVSERVEVVSWDRTASGHSGSWRVHGTLTFHGQAQPLVIPATVRIDGRALVAESAFQVSLKKHKVKPPKLMLMSIDDALDLEGTIRATLSTAPGTSDR